MARRCELDGAECVYPEQVHLEPIVYSIGSFNLLHGERDDEDPENPDHCLCGHPNYMTCSGPGVFDIVIQRA